MSKHVFSKIEDGMQEALETARLANAAPDMLASLKTVDLFLDHLNQSWEFCEHSQSMHDAVKASIAKAEGMAS